MLVERIIFILQLSYFAKLQIYIIYSDLIKSMHSTIELVISHFSTVLHMI
jgi:hypothetical protein